MDVLHDETGSPVSLHDEPRLLDCCSTRARIASPRPQLSLVGQRRYDRAFEPDRCKLLAAAGMILVTGGIEIASDAVLEKIDKGITVVGVIKVLQALAEARIAAHAT